jgi:cytochrome c553
MGAKDIPNRYGVRPAGEQLMKKTVGFLCFALLVPGGARALDRAEIQDVIAQCAACHGAEGIAKDVEIPNLAGQHDRYLVTQLQNFRSGKRPHKEMRYMSRHITDEEIEALAQYYANIPH